jgi:actin related protein 2/3 complex subunit 4
LCLRDFPSILFEKDNKPYIELSGYSPLIDPFVLKPIYLARNSKEQFLIEPSINACRVTFMIKVDKFYPEEKRRYLNADCNEIQQYGCIKGADFRNDKEKANEGIFKIKFRATTLQCWSQMTSCKNITRTLS